MSARSAGSMPRRALATVAVALLVALGSLLGAQPALAHNVLISSNPTDGASLDTAPQKVTFTFDQAIENFDPALKVFGPNGNDFTTGAPTILGTAISAPMAAGPAGEYRAVYRIVSADGHPVTGQITFTLTDAAAGTATGSPTATASAPAEPESSDTVSSGGLGAWLWVIVAAAVVLVVVAVAVAARKPREDR